MSVALALLLLAAREPLGVFGQWGAFREPERCYAIALPARRRQPGEAQAFADVASWPKRGVRHQFHAKLSRPRSARARVTLSVGERRFRLVASATDAWGADSASDQAITAAMRAARSMSIESVDARGNPFADTYALRGAATAIDAAVVACANR